MIRRATGSSAQSQALNKRGGYRDPGTPRVYEAWIVYETRSWAIEEEVILNIDFSLLSLKCHRI